MASTRSLVRLIRELRTSVDAFDVLFGLFPWMAAYMAFVMWANKIVNAIRGEEVTDDWRTTSATVAFIAARSIASATEVRESVALRESVVEMRQLLREAAADAEARDRRAADREDKLFSVTVKMAWVAGFTLLAAIVTLVVTIVK